MAISINSKTYFLVLLILSATHLLNDLMQSLIPASYPILKAEYSLNFVQIGLITLTFQIAASLLQPVIGMMTDRHAAPYGPVAGMMFTFSGLVSFAGAAARAIVGAVGAVRRTRDPSPRSGGQRHRRRKNSDDGGGFQ